jgi:hypothetical protein
MTPLVLVLVFGGGVEYMAAEQPDKPNYYCDS